MKKDDLLNLIRRSLDYENDSRSKDAEFLLEPLEDLCIQIDSCRRNLEIVEANIPKIFENSQNVRENIPRKPTTSFFPGLQNIIETETLEIVNGYLSLAEEFSQSVTVRMMRRKKVYSYNSEKVLGLAEKYVGIHLDARQKIPGIFKFIHKNVRRHNEYLRQKFSKIDNEEMRQQSSLIRQREFEEETPRVVRYVKVPFLDGNPTLTDFLIEISEILPNGSTQGTKSKKPRESSIEEAAEILVSASDPRLLEYLEDPNYFFEETQEYLGELVRSVESIESRHQGLMETPYIRRIYRNFEALRRLYVPKREDTQGTLNRLKKLDVVRWDQSPEETLPENKREKDYFDIRQKFFEKMLAGLRHLSSIERLEERLGRAIDLVRETIPLKQEMEELVISERERKLRKDRSSDNEYYTGVTGRNGAFEFERKPTPEVNMTDVIGQSFDSAKRTINDIIETGEYSRIMRLSAPGRKIKSNMLFIGPFGCGKTEFARAVCSDRRVIGANVSVAGTLTAYMHESVNNVKRIYDQMANLLHEARGIKPGVLVLDEFDGWFAKSENGNSTDTDMSQIENVLLEVLDGMEDYSGIITLAMTNKPRTIPKGILRRFRYIDVVGQLTQEERGTMLRKYLERSFPLASDVQNRYDEWAKKLVDAPGDVIRKVADEIHLSVMPDFIKKEPLKARRIEKTLSNRQKRNGLLGERDSVYLRGRLNHYGVFVSAEQINGAIDELLQKPAIKLQIETARELYADAKNLLDDLSRPPRIEGFGGKN